jgi:hypothetical protein
VPFFEFFNDRGRADVQYPRCIANAARIHRHIDHLLLDRRRETGVGILQEKRPSTPETARTTPIALLAFGRRAMAHDIRVLAVGAMEHLRYHRARSHMGGAVPLKHPSRIADQQI